MLGGGGISGRAWEVGVLAGLRDHGVDLDGADHVIGTSAGAIVAAQLALGRDVHALYREQFEKDVEDPVHLDRPDLLRLAGFVLRHRDATSYRRAVGRWAVAAAAAGRCVSVEARRADVLRMLEADEWPRQPLTIVAVDAETGERVQLTKDSGISLVDAVAATTALPPVRRPVDFAGRRLIDGGFASAANADLAEGAARVVVICPVGHGAPALRGPDRELATLTGNPAVALVVPDRHAMRAMGIDRMSRDHRARSAQAGRAQAVYLAEQVSAAWGRLTPT